MCLERVVYKISWEAHNGVVHGHTTSCLNENHQKRDCSQRNLYYLFEERSHTTNILRLSASGSETTSDKEYTLVRKLVDEYVTCSILK